MTAEWYLANPSIATISPDLEIPCWDPEQGAEHGCEAACDHIQEPRASEPVYDRGQIHDHRRETWISLSTNMFPPMFVQTRTRGLSRCQRRPCTRLRVVETERGDHVPTHTQDLATAHTDV